MNIKRYLLKILLLLVLVGSVANADILVVPFYEIHENSVYYRTENGLEKLQNADAKTFEIFKESRSFGRDKNNVYYLGDKLNKIDPKTFEVVEGYYITMFKDKNGIYTFGKNYDKLKIINFKENGIDIDFNDFKVISSENPTIYRNKNDVYFQKGGKIYPIKNVDAKTFEKINGRSYLDNKYYRDKNDVYYFSSDKMLKLENADRNSVNELSKNILRDILSGAYNTLETPRSVNTLNGLMIVINNTLSKFDEVFIAEMGAYAKGDIKDLANLVKPKYAIITRIGLAHLYTFGSEENILEGKMELVESLPRDGVAVLNRDDPKQVSYHIKNNCKVLWIGIDTEDEVDVKASNIKSTKQGITFDVKFKDDENTYSFKTKLLGVHNVYNILSSLALANSFKIDKKKLVESVSRIKPIEHRLELKKIGNFYQIDDAFNSNPVGASNALDVLDSMPGVKIVVTPGMIELGDKQYEENKKFGKHIAKVADKVILVGEKITKAIKDGLEE